MKRIMLALLILGGGIVSFFAVQNESVQWQQRSQADQESLDAQNILLAEAENERVELAERTRSMKREILLERKMASAHSDFIALIDTNHSLSPALHERLFAELGLNWQTSPDYLMVSKGTLSNILMGSMPLSALLETASEVLAITPEERGRIELCMRDIEGKQNEWVQTHLQRVEPEGNIWAHYALPSDTEWVKELGNVFQSTVNETLGIERAGFFDRYSEGWQSGSFEIHNHASEWLFRRPSDGSTEGRIEHKHRGGSSYSYSLAPESFPEQLRVVFPGGWDELARRENFKLPAEFYEQKK